MRGDALRKVQAGEPLSIPAAAYNAFIDVVWQAESKRLSREGESGRALSSNTVFLVRNDSGSDVDFGQVLGIDGPIFDDDDDPGEFRYRTTFKGVTPTADHAGRFVVATEPIAGGACGRAAAGGVAIARVQVQDEGDGFAEAVSGDVTKLQSGSAGSAIILWKEEGTGLVWAVIRLGQPSSASDGRIRISSNDTTLGWPKRGCADQCHDKIVGDNQATIEGSQNPAAGDGWIECEEVADGANEQLKIKHAGPGPAKVNTFLDFLREPWWVCTVTSLRLDAKGHVVAVQMDYRFWFDLNGNQLLC